MLLFGFQNKPAKEIFGCRTCLYCFQNILWIGCARSAARETVLFEGGKPRISVPSFLKQRRCPARRATEGGMFNLELFVLFVKRVYGSVEILQVFLILAHHVFGKVQEFLRGWSAGMHGAKYTPGERVKIAGVSSGLMA
jgi:hypothetical protein